MNFTNLLVQGGQAIEFYSETYSVSLTWIGDLIKGLIGGAGMVGLGVILFSLILKLIVLPFDVYQRVAMRKQNLKMKENQGKLEKLQKQYANNKEMYNQKMMELYKENGISMFSSCLPAIFSIVIFFVAIGAFNDYAKFANIEYYNQMASTYNEKILDYVAEETQENLQQEGDVFYYDDAEKPVYIKVSDTDKVYYVKDSAVDLFGGRNEVNAYLNENKQEAFNIWKANQNTEVTIDEFDVETLEDGTACLYYIEIHAMENVETAYSEINKNVSFLWIKNIWQTDASYKHPLMTYEELKTTVSQKSGCFSCGSATTLQSGSSTVDFAELETSSIYTENYYNLVTGKLKTAKTESNGYYILIVLSIGTILLQQFVSMRSQKEQQKFSSVDGQGVANQKMTMVMMTVMFAIFSFMYTSAFSIYMITSNLVSLLSTIVINKIVESVMSKKEEKALQEQYNKRFRGTKQSNGKDKK